MTDRWAQNCYFLANYLFSKFVLFQYSVKYLVPMITSLQWVDKFASVQEEAGNPV